VQGVRDADRAGAEGRRRMTAAEEREMHELAKLLVELTRGTTEAAGTWVGWEAMRYAAIGRTMERLATYCAVCDCQKKRSTT
jgi:hypothetical protein